MYLRRMPSLTWANVLPGPEHKTYPCLRGQIIKAANTRCYIPFVAHLAELCNGGGHFCARRMQLAQAARDLNQLFDDQPMFLSAEGETQCAELVRTMLLSYSWLARHSMDRGVLWFNVVPKMHYCSHLPNQSKLVNPRCTRTYIEESLVGRAQVFFRTCLRGTYASTIQGTFLRKYLLGLQVQFSD